MPTLAARLLEVAYTLLILLFLYRLGIAMDILGTFLLLLVGFATGKFFEWLLPPDATLLPGLPLLGNVVGLGRHGVAFISQARKKVGGV